MNEVEASKAILDAVKGLQEGGENPGQIATDFLGFGVSMMVESYGKENTANFLRNLAGQVDKFDQIKYTSTPIN